MCLEYEQRYLLIVSHSEPRAECFRYLRVGHFFLQEEQSLSFGRWALLIRGHSKEWIECQSKQLLKKSFC